jgi:hypothetical protein
MVLETSEVLEALVMLVGGGSSETIKVLLLGVDSIHYNTRQRRNDKQITDVDSIHWHTRQRRDSKQILIVGVDSDRTQSGGLQKDKVDMRDFNSWRRFKRIKLYKLIDVDSKRTESAGLITC